MEDSIELCDNHLQRQNSIDTQTHNFSNNPNQPHRFNNINNQTQRLINKNKASSINGSTVYLFDKNSLSSDLINNNSNSIPLTSIISPKNNRRLMHSYNTTSQQSLAYSNSTYRNKLTQRSPPLFNLDYFHNHDQNVNTINFPFPSSDHKTEITLGINRGYNKGKMIKFDRITEQSKIQSQGNSFIYTSLNNTHNQTPLNINTIQDMNHIDNRQDLLNVWDNHNESIDKQQMVLQLPCFLSHQNSPQNLKFTHHNTRNYLKCSQEQQESQKNTLGQVFNQDSLTIPMKNIYTKPNQEISEKEVVTRRDSKNIEKNKLQSVRKQKPLKTNPSSQKTNHSSLNLNNQSLKTNIILQNKKERIQQEQKLKIEQLEYQLRSSEIEREQLRTRLNVMKQLLQEKFLSSNCNRCYALLQSQKQHRQQQIQGRIQTLVEDRMMQLENRKQSNNNYNRANQNYHSKPINQIGVQVNINKSAHNLTDNRLLQSYSQLHQLPQQLSLQTHLNLQVESLKQQLTQSLLRNKQTQQIINLLQQKQKRFQQIQRPKLFQQVNQLTEIINHQKDIIDKLQMETNLRNFLSSNQSAIQLISPQKGHINSPQVKQLQKQNYPTQTEQIHQQIQKQQEQKPTTLFQKINQNSIPSDTVALLMAQQNQLVRLKSERDYFKNQYQTTKFSSSVIYQLKLKIQDLQNELNSIQQLIQVDDDITF